LNTHESRCWNERPPDDAGSEDFGRWATNAAAKRI
jgi:hypothetical protein